MRYSLALLSCRHWPRCVPSSFSPTFFWSLFVVWGARLVFFCLLNPPPKGNVAETETRITREWDGVAQRVKWLPNFWRVPTSVGLSSSSLYAEGLICGMDASSGAVVHLGLAPKAGENVLDLCCAPGTKLLLTTHLLGDSGTVTGVDNSDHRLNITRNVLRKYGCGQVRLFKVSDGSGFRLLAPPVGAQEPDAGEPKLKKEKKGGSHDDDDGGIAKSENPESLRVGDRVRLMAPNYLAGQTARIESVVGGLAVVAPSFSVEKDGTVRQTLDISKIYRVPSDLPDYDGVDEGVMSRAIRNLNDRLLQLTALSAPNEGDLKSIQALRKQLAALDTRPLSGIGRPKYGPSVRRYFVEGQGVIEWPDDDVAHVYEGEQTGTRNSKVRKRHRFDLPNLFWSNNHLLRVNSAELYDKVIVDAECSTDGAIHHHVARALSEKSIRAAMEPSLVPRGEYRTDEEVNDLVDLQKRLLVRGWALLKPGGILVYSTCSLLAQQNERVVMYLMEQHVNATPEPFENVDTLPVEHSTLVKHAIYFRPSETGGNALFAVRLRKSAH